VAFTHTPAKEAAHEQLIVALLEAHVPSITP
jgi:hypothetical protein